MSDNYINGIDNDFTVEINDVEYEMEEVRFLSEMNKLRDLIKECENALCEMKKSFAQNCKHLEINCTPIYTEDEYGMTLWSSTKYRYFCKRCSSAIDFHDYHPYKEVAAALKTKLDGGNI